jgi:hypothetical protein
MLAKIYDVNMNYVTTIDGKYFDGAINYSEGGYFGFFGTPKKIATSYGLTYIEAGKRIAYFINDGSDYRQLSLGAVPEKYHFSQSKFTTSSKLMDYAIDSALTKPLTLNDLLKNATAIILVICLIASILYGNSLLGQMQATQAPFSKQVNTSIAFEKVVINESAYCYTALNNSQHTIASLEQKIT